MTLGKLNNTLVQNQIMYKRLESTLVQNVKM